VGDERLANGRGDIESIICTAVYSLHTVAVAAYLRLLRGLAVRCCLRRGDCRRSFRIDEHLELFALEAHLYAHPRGVRQPANPSQPPYACSVSLAARMSIELGPQRTVTSTGSVGAANSSSTAAVCVAGSSAAGAAASSSKTACVAAASASVATAAAASASAAAASAAAFSASNFANSASSVR
jgi:hypothetical protein